MGAPISYPASAMAVGVLLSAISLSSALAPSLRTDARAAGLLRSTSTLGIATAEGFALADFDGLSGVLAEAAVPPNGVLVRLPRRSALTLKATDAPRDAPWWAKMALYMAQPCVSM